MNMVKVYEEYIKLLEAELQARNYAPLNENEIAAFIRKHQLNAQHGIVVKDVQADMRTIMNLHKQGKSAAPAAPAAPRSSTPPAGSAAPRSAASTGNSVSRSSAPAGNPAPRGSAAPSSNPVPRNSAPPRPAQQNSSGRPAKGQLTGLSGKTYTLENKAFSSGGEGEIFRIVGDKSQVVKIYHPDRVSMELEQKLRYMANNPPAVSVLDQVAWPMDVLYDGSRQFKGFVMPKLDINAELGDVYVYPPTRPESKIAYNYKLILAMNICTVIHAVHAAGYVFGDFNPRNIGINMQTGRVAFLDTDSYHIVLNEKENKAYRCKVCLNGYVAPELLKHCEPYKKDAYENAPLPTFTKETDNFSLAIHIFKLLMNGYSPFNGIKENETASTASPGIGNEAIKRDSYCFKSGNKPQAAAVPPASVLPDKIKKLFDKAFIDGKNNPKKRPSAQEWHAALSDYEKSLVKCAKNPLHLYKKGLSSCPWCAADEKYRQSINPPMTQRSFPSPVVPPPAPVHPPTSSAGVVRPPSATRTAASSMSSPTPVQKTKRSPQERVAKAASILYPASWILFFASVCLCLAPFVSNGSVSFSDAVLYGMNSRLCALASIIAVALLCFATNLKNASSLGIVLSWIWSFLVCVEIICIRVTQVSYRATEEGLVWALFGILLVFFIAVVISSAKLGDQIRLNVGALRSRPKQKLSTFDVIFLVLLIGVTAFCLPLLLHLPSFYSLASSSNVFAIAVWAAPVVLFILFTTSWSGNQIVGAWFCAAMAVLFACLIFRLGTINLGGPMVYWLILAAVALVLIAFLRSRVENIVSIITILSLFVLLGAVTDIKLLNSGVNAFGRAAYLWRVVPALIDVAAAAAFSFAEKARK